MSSFTQNFPVQTPLTGLLALWIERVGCAMLLLMPLMMFLGIAICDISIVSIAVLFVARSVLLRDFSWLGVRWVQFGLALWLYLLLISPYAVISVKLSFKQALPFGRFVLFAAGLRFWLLKDPQYRQWLLISLGAASLFISLDLIFSFLTGLSLVGKSATQYGHIDHITWVWQRSYSRIAGLNGKLNNGIMLAWVSFPFIIWLLMTIKQNMSSVKRLLAVVALLTLMVGIAVTGERMALLELCLGFLLSLLLVKQLRVPLLCIGIIAIASIGGLLWSNPGLWSRNVTQVHQAISTLGSNDYGRIFFASMAIFLDHPLFGIGLKQYYLISFLPQYVPFNAINSHVQNIYLEFLTGTGLIGTGLFLAMLGAWLSSVWRGRDGLFKDPIAIGILIALVLRMWPLASTTSFFYAWGAISFWWMGAWLLVLTEENSHA